jgi:hypothetical protein
VILRCCQVKVAIMRGPDEQTAPIFSYVSCEVRVPANHPLRLSRAVVDEALDVLSSRFDGLYAEAGRPSIAPEKLPRALLSQAFYPIRSERESADRRDMWPGCDRWRATSAVQIGRDAGKWVYRRDPRQPALSKRPRPVAPAGAKE